MKSGPIPLAVGAAGASYRTRRWGGRSLPSVGQSYAAIQSRRVANGRGRTHPRDSAPGNWSTHQPVADRSPRFLCAQPGRLGGSPPLHRPDERGSTLERPQLRCALAEARFGCFDLLLVYRVDRLSRSQALRLRSGLEGVVMPDDAGGRTLMSRLAGAGIFGCKCAASTESVDVRSSV